MHSTRGKFLCFETLHRCFKDGGRLYNIHALVEECNKALVRAYGESGKRGKRSIYGYISELQGEPYNVELDEELLADHYYRYADTSFQLDLLNFTDQDRVAINKTLDLLQPIYDESQNPLYAWMISSLLGLSFGQPIDVVSPTVSFQSNEFLKGREHFRRLMEAVQRHEPLEILYRPFHAPESMTFHLHPYFLKEYNNRWFLLGKAEERPQVTNLALDRIEEVRHWETTFVPSKEDFSEYFDDVVGVSVNMEDQRVYDVVLKVSAWRFPYIETKPLHWSQTELKDQATEETRTIRLKVRLTPELTTMILSYGPDMEVVGPEKLREEVREKAAQMMEKYR